MKKITGIMISAAFAFAASAARAESRTKLIYALPTTVPAVIPYVALEKGYFLDEGLDVEGRMFSSGREALQALLSKHAQLQSVSETPVVHAILQGNEIVIVATVAEHMETKLIARKDRGIRRPKDLRGKRVATLPGTNSDYFMHRFFEKHGIALKDVRITNMPPPAMVVAFVKGDIDAYFAWEPHIYYGKRQLPKNSRVFYPKELYSGRTTVNMNRDFVRKNPEVVRKVVRALLKAEDYVRRNPKDALKIASERLKMDPEILEELWPEHVFKVQLDKGFLSLLKEVGRWAAERGKRTKPLPDFRDHIYDQALKAERPSAVGF